ncbi:hypothetical protein [Candidatus Anaplasma sp. TIGMIC]|uniref:hypothetical protein n=1 Tax=Candidatus Anaplasma sp. TIGMIC TaxID=3020713 RepID=UPI00232FF2B0|nr:hypothetical protein [Candidatus Anaplasma sp. TIGMIC]MDB1135425.1 hypothetical protein [Candidatus Anaplasma sp. TIGMIC]
MTWGSAVSKGTSRDTAIVKGKSAKTISTNHNGQNGNNTTQPMTYDEYENALKSLAKTKFGNLYSFSSLASQHLSRRSNVMLGAETMYAFICDPLYQLLVRDNSAHTFLNESCMKTVFSSTLRIDCTTMGNHVAERRTEIKRICSNHKAENSTTLRKRSEDILDKAAHKLTLRACDMLYTSAYETTNYKLREYDSALRLLYTSFVYEAERYAAFPENGCSLIMSLMLKNQNLHSCIRKYDYSEFLNELRAQMLQDSIITKRVLKTAMADALQRNKRLFNTLLTCLVSCSSPELNAFPEQKSFLVTAATACINQLMHYSPKLSISIHKLFIDRIDCTNLSSDDVLTLITELGNGAPALVSGIYIPDIYREEKPIIDNSNHGIERIMAATLILYPGAKISGEEVLLHEGKPVFTNLENGKVIADHPFFNAGASEDTTDALNTAILSDIRQLFSSVREMVPNPDWDAFVTHLHEICALMRSEEFAKTAKREILSKSCRELPGAILHDDHFSTIAYESILPRVNNIERFFQNERLAQAAHYYTKLMYDPDKEIFSAADFLKVSGCVASGTATEQDNTAIPTRFFETIDKHLHKYVSGPDRGSESSVQTNSQTVSSGLCSFTDKNQYKLADLSTRERAEITQTLSRRSSMSVVEWERWCATGAVAVFFATGSVYAAFASLVPIWVAGMLVTQNVILLVFACVQTTVEERKSYVMSVDTSARKNKCAFCEGAALLPTGNEIALPAHEPGVTVDQGTSQGSQSVVACSSQVSVPGYGAEAIENVPSGSILDAVSVPVCMEAVGVTA